MSRRTWILLLLIAGALCYGGWVLWKAKSLRSDLRRQCDGIVGLARRHQLDALDVTLKDATRRPFRDVGAGAGDLVDVRLAGTWLDKPPSATFREIVGYCEVELKFARETKTIVVMLDRAWEDGDANGWALKALLPQD